MDCQTKVVRTSSVETKLLPGDRVFIARDLRVAKEVVEKVKYAQMTLRG